MIMIPEQMNLDQIEEVSKKIVSKLNYHQNRVCRDISYAVTYSLQVKLYVKSLKFVVQCNKLTSRYPNFSFPNCYV